MITVLQHDLLKKGQKIATLAIFVEGTGNPADEHKIVGVSIDGFHFGANVAPIADKCENLEDINLSRYEF